MRAPLGVLAVLLVALAPACKCAGSGQAAPDAGDDEDRVRPVYDLNGPVDPLAARLCDSLHKVAGERRAQCCPGTAAGINLASQCAGMLSAALRSRAVTLAPEAADRCSSAIASAHSGCDWVGPNDVPLPEACSGIFSGTLAPGARCRSALECQGELRCAGGGPTDTGRCAPPGPQGSACELAVDPLATYTRQDSRLHSECDGYCLRHVCHPPLEEKCLIDVQCPRGKHCGKGECLPGVTARAGEPCSAGGCESSLRCVQGTCRAPAPDGTPCANHLECLGACVPTDAGSRCGPGCGLR